MKSRYPTRRPRGICCLNASAQASRSTAVLCRFHPKPATPPDTFKAHFSILDLTGATLAHWSHDEAGFSRSATAERLFNPHCCLALSSSGALSFSPQIELRRGQDFEKLVAKIQSGEVQPTKDKWIEMLRSSRNVELAAERGHVVLTRYLACGILIGVVLQAYVLFRVRSGRR